MPRTDATSHIRRLDPALVNKIAAGEVIERPASVVKELLENAIDAGATRIDLALENGGTQLIRVTDNGRGIAPEDLPLAVASHATSKLATVDDLFNIRSLGFRGEALASIASVSHLTLRSRTADSLEACELTISDDESDAPPVARACSAPPGTTVEIRNLFYNVPARRKFLRHAGTEHANVTEQIARLALAHPGIAFTASHNGRSTRNLPSTGDRRGRIADFYGPELAECLMTVNRQERELGIEALIAPPAEARSSTKWQYLFLNGRYILDRRIGFAVREAFRGLVEHGRYPVVFMFLTIDPSAYDVNVHPTKIEVRWRDAGLVQSQILAVLRETLLGHDLTPVLRTPNIAAADATADTDHNRSTRHALADYLKSIDPTQARLRFESPRFPTRNIRPSLAPDYVIPIEPARFRPGAGDNTQADRANGDIDGATDQSPKRERGTIDGAGQPVDDLPAAGPVAHAPGSDRLPAPQGPTVADASAQAASDTADDFAPAAPVVQLHNTYLVAETEEGIIIVDQHALHERILYEKFKARFLAGPLESQRLLLPESLSVSPAQAQAVENNKETLARLGIEIEPFGPKSVAVQAFPVLLGGVDIKTFILDLLDRLADTEGTESDETVIHKALDMMACKAAVKAGDVLSTEEIQVLLAQRHLISRSSNCPHGRPTTLQLTTRDLERQFKRI